MTTQTLTEFLLARIAEDEAMATSATPGEWRVTGTEWDRGWMQSGYVHSDSGHDVAVPEIYGPDCAFLVANQPIRVLAECRAKRRIVEEYADLLRLDTDEADDHGIHGQRLGLEHAVKALALTYADHADYRQEWRP